MRRFIMTIGGSILAVMLGIVALDAKAEVTCRGFDKHNKWIANCTGKFVWQPDPYPTRAPVTALKGAREVMLELFKHPAVITTMMESMAKVQKIANVKKYVSDQWELIRRQSPPDNQVMHNLLFATMLLEMNNPKAPTHAKQLIASFEAYIRSYQTHMAQDALNAYDAWKIGDLEFKKRSGQHKTMLGLVDFGSPPPDFSQTGQAALIAASVAPSLAGSMAAIQSFGAALASAHAATSAAVTAGLTGGTAATAGGSSAGTAGSLFATGVTGSSTAMAGAMVVALPFAIIAGAAINQFVAIVSARPKLEAALREAQKPVSFKKLMATAEGRNKVSMYWNLALAPPDQKHQMYILDGALNGAATQAYQLWKNPPQKIAMPTSGQGKWQSGGFQITAGLPAVGGASGKSSVKSSKSVHPSKWQFAKLPGGAIDIAVGDDNRAAVIGPDQTIWFQKGNSWTKIEGKALRIAIAGKQPWIVAIDGTIWRRDGNKWTGIKGPKAYDIGAKGAAVWIIAGKEGPAGYGVYSWTGNTWKSHGGEAIRIAVKPDGYPWVVTANQETWVMVKGKWKKSSGAGIDISSNPSGVPMVVGMDGNIWAYDVPSQQWANTKKKGVSVAFGPDGKAWYIDTKLKIHKQK